MSADDIERPTRDEVARAYAVMDNYRAAHAYPLTKARMGLQSMCRTAGVGAETSQRLKRHRTILDKLQRYPKMRLSSMQDVAGCRAVVDGLPSLRAVQSRVQGSGRVVREPYDYVSAPKGSGYRGVHLIVEYDERPVEVQIRTRIQHEWAYTVERVGSRLGVDLKSGHGPEEVLRLFRLVSEAMEIEEAGRLVPEYLLRAIAEAKAGAEAVLREGRS